MSSSTKIISKRRSITLAEVDVVNSNAFKQTQLNLDKQNLRLNKHHAESMLLHNREYAELKRFLYSIRAVNSEDGYGPSASLDSGMGADQGKNLVRSVTAPDKDSLSLVPQGDRNKHPARPKTVAERASYQGVHRQRAVSDSTLESGNGDTKVPGKTRQSDGATSEPTSPRKLSFGGADHRLPRLMLPASSPIPEDQPSTKQSRQPSENPTKANTPRPPVSKDGRKSHTITLEFNMNSDVGGRRLTRSTSLDGQLAVPVRKPPRSPAPDPNNNNSQQKLLSSSLPLPSHGNNGVSYAVPSVNFLHPKGAHPDPSGSSSSRSSSPMSGVPSRRHSYTHPISSTSIRKSVELSEGFAMDTNAYDPSVHADTTGRRFSSDDGSPAGSAPRSLLPLKSTAPKVSHAKSMEVMVASQKQILQRRKTLSQLNTRLLTAGECIEIQNKRRDRIHGIRSEEAGGEKGGVWAKEPFFVNRPGNKPTRKNSTVNKDKDSSKD